MIRRPIEHFLAWRANRIDRKLERERMQSDSQEPRNALDILFPPSERRPRRCGHEHHEDSDV